MPQPKKAAKELAAAFREVGMRDVEVTPDFVCFQLGQEHRLEVKAISVGHGRPQELRNALAHGQLTNTIVTATFVADHFTTGAIEVLRENRVNYLDDCRFVFQVEQPFIAIKHDRECQQKPRQAKELGLGGRIGIAVQELLLDERDWWQVTDLANAADVAAGTAQAALNRLQASDLLVAEGTGPRKRRRVIDKGALLDRWAADAKAERHRLFSTYVYAQGPRDLASAVSTRLREAGIEHAVTGAAAGWLIAPHATDVRICEVWVDPTTGVDMLAAALGTAPVEKGGNVVILQTKTDAPLFRAEAEEGVVIANPLRVYADLLADPKRGQEQAQFLREVRLGF